MPLYEIKADKIDALVPTTFEQLQLRERDDLQRLLKDKIEIIYSDILVISEGFRDWEDSRRELDLLAIDKEGNLVVIELKRTEDAGHAELQAIRYSAMVSTMTFDKAVEVYREYLRKNDISKDAVEDLLDFLDWDEPDEDRFAQDVRIVLVSANFSKELTTSVMWLNERSLDIRCVRMQPYKYYTGDSTKTIVDVEQVIPLPEAQDYIIKIRDKAVKERQDRIESSSRKEELKAFWENLLPKVMAKTALFNNVAAIDDNWINAGSGLSGVHYMFQAQQHLSAVRFIFECNNKDLNKQRFDWVQSNLGRELEQVIGSVPLWHRRDDVKRSYIEVVFEGGYKDSESWGKLHESMAEMMSKFEKVLSPHIQKLREIL